MMLGVVSMDTLIDIISQIKRVVVTILGLSLLFLKMIYRKGNLE